MGLIGIRRRALVLAEAEARVAAMVEVAEAHLQAEASLLTEDHPSVAGAVVVLAPEGCRRSNKQC